MCEVAKVVLIKKVTAEQRREGGRRRRQPRGYVGRVPGPRAKLRHQQRPGVFREQNRGPEQAEQARGSGKEIRPQR